MNANRNDHSLVSNALDLLDRGPRRTAIPAGGVAPRLSPIIGGRPAPRGFFGGAKLAALLAVCVSAWMTPLIASAQANPCPDGSAGTPWIGVHAFHCPGGTCSSTGLYLMNSSGEMVAFVEPDRGEPGVAADRIRTDASGEAALTLLSAEYEFSAEPWLRGIDSGGPAAGVLEEGDVLVAVNGYLITSRRGGRELGNLPLNVDARLTVRRNDRLVEVSLRPVARCDLPMGISGNTMLRIPEDRGMVLDGSPGSLGASFSCDRCSFTLSEGGRLTWDNPQHLEIVAVERGGPADRAGLRPGDVILSVNGLDLQSASGGDLLLNPDPGVTLALDVRRRNDQIGVEILTRRDDSDRDPREDFVVYRNKSWGKSLSDLLFRWSTNVDRAPLRPEFAMVLSGDSWAPAVYGAVFAWCDDCRWISGDDFGWEMPEYPVVESITPGGAADAAGLRVDDVLTHIDGKDLRTEAGGRAFIDLRSGERVEVRYQRGGRQHTATLVAGEILEG